LSGLLSWLGIDTDVFAGTITFTTTASSGTILQVTLGDTITATFSDELDTASIFTRTVAFDSTTYNPASIASVTITDQNSNLVPGSIENVVVTITSQLAANSTSNPITIVATETGVNTGVFGGAIDNSIIFMNGHLPFILNQSVKITQEDPSANSNPALIETINVLVTSDTDSIGTSVTLTETAVDSGTVCCKL